LPTLAEMVSFCERHVRTRDGARWSLSGREWVRDQFFLPADGFKLWRPRDRPACASCLELVGQIVETAHDNTTTACECGGLDAEPILVTILNLDRGDGKTLNMAAYSLAHLALGRNDSQAALWASEDQGTQVFNETWLPAIEQSAALRKRMSVYGSPPQVHCQSTRSRLEVLTSSHRSLTGRRRRRLLVDEARDVEARSLTALLPSINAMRGVECPRGCVQLTPEDVAARTEPLPETCAQCGGRIEEWWPRLIIASACGTLNGTEKDWLHELVEEISTTPHQNYHLFTPEKWGRELNPRKSARVTSAVTDVFGKLPSTQHYVEAEMGGRWTRKGQDVITIADLKRVMSRDLVNADDIVGARAVGFLDTSTTVEKTSLVILTEDAHDGSDAGEKKPWERVTLSHLEYWWPGHNCGKLVPADRVQYALETVLPLYPGLVDFAIDAKAGVSRDPEYLWPSLMLRELRNGTQPWRRKLRTWTGGRDGSNDDGWDLLIERIMMGTISLPYSTEIIEEVKGLAMVVRGDDRAKVRDRNREIMHRDITQALACACYMLTRLSERERRGQSSIAERVRRSGTRPATVVARARGQSKFFGNTGENSW